MPDDAIERARQAICEDVWLSIPAYLHKSIINGIVAFASQQAPEGWRLVPINPTPEMTDAARTAFLHDMRGRKLLKYLFEEDPSNVGAYGDVDAPIDVEIQSECAGENAVKVWSAMLDAAPSVTLGEVG